MDIHVNGEPRSVADGSTLGDLIDDLRLTGRIAVELNGEIVPRSEYPARVLRDRDSVEVVRAIGGGAL